MKKVKIILWAVSLLMYVGGFSGLYYGAEFLGINWQTWFWNALVVGILAIGAKF
ncbi:MAG: hypothetical protein Q8R12_03810 [bacterium]|nr:hypothetical protein [bacterium]